MGFGSIWLVRRTLQLAERISLVRYLMRAVRSAFILGVIALFAWAFCAGIFFGARSVGGAGWMLLILCVVPVAFAYRVARHFLKGIWRGDFDLHQPDRIPLREAP